MLRYEVIEKCLENLNMANGIINNQNINQIVKTMTQPLINRINYIQEICSVEKYNLCFIGKVGVGKSTAITNLLGLVDKRKIEIGYKLIDIPLLKTAEGRTTLCETIIYFTSNSKTKIEIQELEYSEFSELVDDFCSALFNKFNSDNEEKLESSLEDHRAIRNMSGVPLKDKEKQIQYVFDVLKEEYNEEDGKSQVKRAILKRINYSSRTKKTFIFDGVNAIEDWIKSTIEKVNDGEMEGAPYPSKMLLSISDQDIEVNIPDFIASVRDTRGIDGEGVREDVIEICKDINNICIMCDEIKNFGNIASEGFLKNQFILKNKDLKYRNFVMGLEQGAQLSKANGAVGRENGKDKKKEEAINNWRNICLDEENVFFYNSFFGIKYESDEQEIISVDFSKYENERKSILKIIDNKLSRMYEEYSRELGEISRQLNIFHNNQIEDSHKDKLIKISNTVRSCFNDLEKNYELFFESLNKQVRTEFSAGVIRASVNRKGIYDNYDIYVQAKNISYEEFDSTCKAPLYHIDKEINTMLDNKEIMDAALLMAIKYETDDLFKKYREKNSGDYYTLLKENIYNEDICWLELRGYWGNKMQGIKYRDRVADSLLNVIKDKKVLQSIIEKENTYNFFKSVYSFMGTVVNKNL
ncbi:hypothetical protein [Paenibacillus thalictri]|uniref:Uncharacterized protein n=1 Tax=Paenibacillus thalictri TaxID=2527873 RepID=A0A4Q9DV38_9BACL|nr:hypothetical protein [Paenibacillus thalictri]TBL80859.1 hypothetical protein EYB31_06485 [Paenibacillus thalictri]